MWCERCALLLHEGGEKRFASPERQLIAVYQLHIRIRLGRREREREREEEEGLALFFYSMVLIPSPRWCCPH